MSILEGDLSLPTVVKAMVDNERSWEAVVSFSESVMPQKEAGEGGRRRFGLLLQIDSAQNSAGSRHGGLPRDPVAPPNAAAVGYLQSF
jgi:hypothetical protein